MADEDRMSEPLMPQSPPTVPAAGYLAPWPGAQPAPTPSRRSPWPRVIALLCALTIFAGVVTAVVRRGGKDYPDEWDPRVLDLVGFVEDNRDLFFKHPVLVEFLTAEEYSDRVGTEESELTDEDKESIDRSEATFRAFGLLHGETDLFEASNTLVDEGTLAFYSPASESIVVRGTEVDVPLQVTLVHELTHALQDQHFDLERMQDVETTGEEFASRAVIEGDASRIEDMYVDGLSAEELAEYEADQPETPEDAGLGDVPAALLAFFGAPYQFGAPFVGIGEADGAGGVDALFEDPPTSDEHLFDPYSYRTGDAPAPLDALDAPDDLDAIEQSDFGAIALYVMLAERIDPRVALQAVDGWRGDAYVSYERDDQLCVAVRFVTDTGADFEQLSSALTLWDEAMPADAVSVDRSDDEVGFEACDPGVDGTLPLTGNGAKGLVFAEVRAYEYRKAVESGLDDADARCYSQKVIDAVSLEQLVGDVDISPEDIGAVEQAAVQACGIGG